MTRGEDHALLFVGDVIGKPGRQAVKRLLPKLVDEHRIDYVIVNVENIAGGFGVTPETLAELDDLPIDCYHHRQSRLGQEGGRRLASSASRACSGRRTTRRATPDRGVHVGETAAGIAVATINLEGQVFMKNVDSPFRGRRPAARRARPAR